MQAQETFNKSVFDAGQAARILADLNVNGIKEQAPINHVENGLYVVGILKMTLQIASSTYSPCTRFVFTYN